MKPLRFIHVFFGVAAIAIACGFTWSFYESVRNQKEAARIGAVQTLLEHFNKSYSRSR